MIEIELALLSAFDGLVAFSKTVLADVRGTLRTLCGGVTLLLADTASSLEHSWLRTVGLRMAVVEDCVSKFDSNCLAALTLPRHS